MLIESVLKKKGSEVTTISPNATVFEAIVEMERHNIGALLVMEKGEIAGIITERDYAHKVAVKGKSSKEIPVSDVMTTEVCFVDKKKNLNECMAVMSSKHVRHLPVLEDSQLIGLVSIGDIVKNIIDEQEHEIGELIGYINGTY
jgi:CBS domain-containing protein